MKKYIFAFLLFLLAIIGIDNAFALTSPYWGTTANLIRPQNISIFDCSTTNCNVDLNARTNFIANDNSVVYFSNDTTTSMSSGGAGVMWAFQIEPNLKSNYLYSLNIYVCHNSSNDLVYRGTYANTTMSGTTNLSNTVNVYSSISQTNLNQYVYPNLSYNKCGFINTIFVPNNNSKFIGINYGLNGSASNYFTYFMGYNITALGNASNLSSSDIQNVINNSGLASSSDINNLNTAISDIQSELSDDISDAESNIISSQEQTRDAIINNQNENTNKEIESQKVCKYIDKNNVKEDGFLNSLGNIWEDSNYGITDYIKIINSTIQVVNIWDWGNGPNICFYNENKEKISCIQSSNTNINIPNNTSYVRFSIYKPGNKPTYNICTNGNQALDDSINDLNGKITDSAVTGGIGSLAGWFDNFNTDTFGLTSVITSPLNLIRSLTSKTCSPLHLQIPFINQTMDLPCMTTIYSDYFGTFLTLYQTITFGITSYWVCVRLFNLVKDFKNPDHDEIEVMDL